MRRTLRVRLSVYEHVRVSMWQKYEHGDENWWNRDHGDHCPRGGGGQGGVGWARQVNCCCPSWGQWGRCGRQSSSPINTIQCWSDAGATSPTLSQHQTSTGSHLHHLKDQLLASGNFTRGNFRRIWKNISPIWWADWQAATVMVFLLFSSSSAVSSYIWQKYAGLNPKIHETNPNKYGKVTYKWQWLVVKTLGFEPHFLRK